MTYVPIVVPPTPPSPRTRELADQLARVMVDFEQKYPTMSRQEMTEATRLALQATRSSGGVAPMLTALVGLGVAAAVGLAVYLGVGTGAGGASLRPAIAVVAGALLVGALLFVLRRQP